MSGILALFLEDRKSSPCTLATAKMLASLKAMKRSLFSRSKAEVEHVDSGAVTEASDADESVERSMAERQIWRVLYGTATRAERSKKMAGQLHEALKGACANQQVDLVRTNDYNNARSAGKHMFGEEKALFVVVSTYGDGEPPDDSRSFFWWLRTEADSGRKPLEVCSGIPLRHRCGQWLAGQLHK